MSDPSPADVRGASPDVHGPTDDFRGPSPDVSSPSPDISSPSPDISSPTPDVRSPTPDVRSPTPDVRSPTPDVRAPSPSENAWIERHLNASWGSTTVVSRGVAHDASRLPAFVAVQDEEIVGLATFRIADGECELVTLDALRPGQGTGVALLTRVRQEAIERGCRRLWLITTNDNLNAIRFYQRRGMRLVAVHRGAVDEARRIKPIIPLIGEHGIPIHDELEFELHLG